MATGFDSVSDAELTSRLQALFHETVRLQTMLETNEAESARLKGERRDLEARVKASHDEISRIVKEMRRRMPEPRGAAKATAGISGRSVQRDLMHQAIFAAAR